MGSKTDGTIIELHPAFDAVKARVEAMRCCKNRGEDCTPAICRGYDCPQFEKEEENDDSNDTDV